MKGFGITSHIKRHANRHLKIHEKVPVHTSFLHHHKKHKHDKARYHNKHQTPTTDPMNGT